MKLNVLCNFFNTLPDCAEGETEITFVGADAVPHRISAVVIKMHSDGNTEIMLEEKA